MSAERPAIMGGLAGKVVLVTGAASGIGLATAELFSRSGAQVALVDIQQEAAEDAAGRLRQSGQQALAIPADVRRSQEVRQAVGAVVGAFGRLDVLFANAGVGSTRALMEATDEEWDRVMDVNAWGVFYCCREGVRQMLAQDPPGGSVVITGSISSQVGIPGQAVYASAKGALLQMTRQFAIEYAARGIRVNCVCPGSVDTPVLQKAMAESPDGEAFLKMLIDGHPIGRIARPEEIATAVAFLASDYASFITGAILPVDGGYTAR